jgi:LacI family transcriptional regulator
MRVLPKIGVSISSNGYTQGIARGVADYVRKAPPSESFTIIWQVSQDLNSLKRWQGDGLIGGFCRKEMESWVRRNKQRVVNVSLFQPTTLPTVGADDYKTGQMACEHLIERGFEQMGFIGFPDVYYSTRRWEGFRDTALAAGASASLFEFSTQQPLHRNTPAVRQELLRWLRKQPRPMGLMLAIDSLATLVYDACSTLNLNIPDDMAIIGADNDPMMAGLIDPSLSSVDIYNERVGYEAARMMARMLRGETPPESPVLIQPRGIASRQSTDTFTQKDEYVASALRYIWRMSHQSISVQDVIKHVACSRRTLENRFREQRGRTPLEEIQRARIERVKRRLVETDRSIAEIAQDCGFAYIAQLNAAFRKHTSMTPGMFREQSRMSSGGSNGPLSW